jgi:hypothetical protein
MVYGANDLLARTNPPDAGPQAFVMSTKPGGNVNWSHLYGTAAIVEAVETDTITGVASADNGQTIVSGWFEGCLYELPQEDLGLPCPAEASGPIDAYVLGLDEAGAESWRTLVTSPALAGVSRIATGAGGRIGFAAEFQGSVEIGTTQHEGITTRPADKNRVLGELDSSGNLEWSYVVGVSEKFAVSGLDFGAEGLLVSGWFNDGVMLGSTTPTPTGEQNGFLAHLDASGEPVWFIALKGQDDDDVVTDVKVDEQGRILTTINYTDEAEFSTATLDGEDAKDAAFVMLDSDRQVLWTESFAFDGDDTILQADIAAGRVAAAMRFEGGAELRGTAISQPIGGTYLVLFDEPAP